MALWHGKFGCCDHVNDPDIFRGEIFFMFVVNIILANKILVLAKCEEAYAYIYVINMFEKHYLKTQWKIFPICLSIGL